MADRADITPALCRQLLRYDAESGLLYWRERGIELFNGTRAANICGTWNTRYANQLAFTAAEPGGYLRGRIFGQIFVAHRVAWAIYHGVWPTNIIDHIDGNGANNRIDNLRDVSGSINQKNRRINSNNTSMVNGVSWHKRTATWRASITTDGKTSHLGHFSSFDEAVTARLAANKRLGFTNRHGGTA